MFTEPLHSSDRVRKRCGEWFEDSLHYVRPDEPFTESAAADLFEVLTEARPELVVLDGVTEAMISSGLDPLSNRDAAQFNQKLIRPILDRTGAALLSLDHVTKGREDRGRWALGAQHKLAAAMVS